MLPITTTRQRFTSVGHILQPQLPTALRLAVTTSPHGSAARLSGGGYSVPSASHLGVAPDARPGRVPVAEHRIFDFPDKYACDFVSHVRDRCRARACGRSDVGAGGPEAGEGHMQGHPTRRQAIRRRDSGASAKCWSRCPGAGRIGAFTGCRRAQGERGTVRVGTAITGHPPHRSGRDQFGHPVLR
jgi:hypothetical protein